MDKDKLKRIKNILLFYFGKNKITMGETVRKLG